jgi:quercetin dioxygenase-like cupin family protein
MTTEGKIRKRSMGNTFPYQNYMEDEGIPLFKAVAGTDDVTKLPRKPWARTGGNGTFIELVGTFESERGVFVQEIPGGKSLNPIHHAYQEELFILEGRGLTEVWQGDGSKISFEWGEGSIFAIPKNVEYRLVNGSRDPAIYLSVSNAPRVINALDDLDYVFNNPQPMFDLYGEGREYFNASDVRVAEGRYEGVIWHTNFIPDARGALLDNLEQKVAGGQLTGYRMGDRFPHGHISEWPSGRYHKAHYHGPGAILLGLDGEGYVNVWPSALGPHPWADGHEDQVMKVIWGRNSIYSPPNANFHQHLNTSNGPAKHAAVYGDRMPMGVHNLQDGSEGFVGYVSQREGGTLIEYEDEDPRVREDFAAEIAQKGITLEMPPVTYRTS